LALASVETCAPPVAACRAGEVRRRAGPLAERSIPVLMVRIGCGVLGEMIESGFELEPKIADRPFVGCRLPCAASPFDGLHRAEIWWKGSPGKPREVSFEPKSNPVAIGVP
jgi:hypothetical protein